MSGFIGVDPALLRDLQSVALAMFRKNFFGIFHGSLSFKIDEGNFLINKKDAIFDDLGVHNLTQLYHKPDYRWKEASIDAPIHSQIYQSLPNAKFVAYGMPPFAIAYTLNHRQIVPRDYFGHRILGTLQVYDPRDFDNWYERADSEIVRFFRESGSKIMVIKGYGAVVYSRDLHDVPKLFALLENTCKLLHFASLMESSKKTAQDIIDI